MSDGKDQSEPDPEELGREIHADFERIRKKYTQPIQDDYSDIDEGSVASNES